MVIELGAGGLVMVTPPRKGSQLDKDLDGGDLYIHVDGPREDSTMHDCGSVVDIGSGRLVHGSTSGGAKSPKDKYEVYERTVYKRDHDTFVINHTGDGRVEFVVLHNKGDIILDNEGNPIIKGSPDWKRYDKVIFDHDPSGEPIGVLHAVGEIIVCPDGKVIPADFDYRKVVPRVTFNGIRDGETRRCKATHVNEVGHLDTEELHVILHRITEELLRRQLTPVEQPFERLYAD